MESFDPVAGEFERVARFGVAAFHRGVDFTPRDAQAAGIKIKAVELAGRLDQRDVASRSHVIDDGAGGGLDIGRYLALGREESRESRGKIGAASVETNGHGGFPAGRPWSKTHCSMARRQIAVNPLVY